MEKRIQIAKKSNYLEPGIVFAPYISMTTTNPIIVDVFTKSLERKRKINKIFDLGIAPKEEFSSKSIMSRYSKKVINNKYYETIEIKKPTF